MPRRAPVSGRRWRPLSGSRPLRAVCAAIALVLVALLPAHAQQAPDFTLKDLSGQAWSLSASFPGKVVLLDFWATWCAPCLRELPQLQRLQDAYGEKGLQVVTISIDGPDLSASVSQLVARYGFTFPVLLDTESRVVSVYDPSLLLPHSVIVDRRGVIRHVRQGYSPGDERLLEERILALLAESETKNQSRTSFRGSNAFLLRLPEENTPGTGPGDVYSEGLDQLDVTLSMPRLLAGARLDSNLDLSPAGAEFSLAKRYVEYATKHFQARAGDFYTSLGRGLVFSLLKAFEQEDLDYIVDTTVDGGRASFTAGPVTGAAFGGWVDRAPGAIVRDEVVGFGVGSTWPGVATIGVQGVRARLEPGSEFRNRLVETGSVSVELPEIAGALAVYGEFSLMRRRTYQAAAPIDGHGLYVGSKLHAGRFSLLVELKDYEELNFEFSRPPLLESEELELLADQFDLDRTDVSGQAARLDYYAPASKTLLFGKYLRTRDHPGAHRTLGSYDRAIDHVHGGIEKEFAGGGFVHGLAGWRRENAWPDYFPTEGETIHDQVNAGWPLVGAWSLEGDWKHKRFDGDSYGYSEIRAALSLHRSPRWVVSALYEYTTDPAILYFTGRKDYYAGQLELRLSGGHSLRLFAGATKGSVKCSGGVCRLFPAFDGARLEALIQF